MKKVRTQFNHVKHMRSLALPRGLQRLGYLYMADHNSHNGLFSALAKMNDYVYFDVFELRDVMELCGFPEVTREWVVAKWPHLKVRDAEKIMIRYKETQAGKKIEHMRTI